MEGRCAMTVVLLTESSRAKNYNFVPNLPTTIISRMCGWNWMKIVWVAFWESWDSKFCKAHQMNPNSQPQTKLKESDMKSTLHIIQYMGLQYSSVSLCVQLFSWYAYVRNFPLTPMLKFKSATKNFKASPKVIACIPPWQAMFLLGLWDVALSEKL